TQVTDDLGETRALGGLTGEYEMFTGLKLKVSLGADYAARSRDTYYNRNTYRGRQNGGDALRGETQNLSYLNENTLTWHRTIGASHDLTLLGGYSWQTSRTTGFNMGNSNFVSDATEFWDIGSGTQAGGPSLSSRYSRWTMASYLGRLNYNLLGRYLVTLTGRYDGSSRFGANHQWGFFPSAAIGWRVSEEPFLRDVGFLDELKVRASYGLAGNPSIPPYNSKARLEDQGYSFGGVAVGGFYPYSVANPNLTWESTRQLDIGVDAGVFDRVTLTADYYHKRTNDLLLYTVLPAESGYRAALQNIGSVENRGIELGLGVKVLRPENDRALHWTADLNYSRNRNKVLDLGGVDELFATSVTSDLKFPGSLIRVGQPIGVFYGYQTLGVYRDSAAVLAYSVRKNINGRLPLPGDMIVADLDGDSVITAADRTIIGNPNPDFTVGLSNTFAWHGF
ncbi:MAG TPA: TonB-dependent receptor, partial [Longimicrobiaceae bacterium]